MTYIYGEHDYLKLIPVQNKGKVPTQNDWKSKPVTMSYFDENPQYNIGVLLGKTGNNIVDIDLDHPLAASLAPYFLPETGMVFGRPSNPGSHWVYRVEDSGNTKKFQHGNLGMIVEYRAEGAMTVFPGSTHVTGEAIEFSRSEAPTNIMRDELMNKVGHLAAATLLAENWNTGQRHSTALAVSGTLFNAGWTENAVREFISAICIVINDDEKSDRLQSVATTRQRFDQGEPLTGWPSLAGLIGEEVAKKFAEWLNLKTAVASTASDRSIILESCTDAGNGKYFAAKNRDDWFYHADKGCWYTWNGSVWVPDRRNEIRITAHATANSIYQGSASITEIANWVKASQSSARITAMINESEPYMSKSTSDLNCSPLMLNCKNGTIELADSSFKNHDPLDYHTQIADVFYDPEALCPQFVKFMRAVCQGDQQLIRFIQTIFGYCMTSDTSEQKMFIFYGNGSNGKGTLIDTIRSVLSDYAMVAQAESFMQKSMVSGSGATPDMARLADGRVVFVSEGDRTNKLDEALVKQLTGQDTVAARELYKSLFEFKPKFKLIFQTNYLPKIRGTDAGIWRRIVPIPFEASFTGDQVDKNLREKLLEEKSGILNWLLEGYQIWKIEGLVEPKCVLNAQKSYRSSSDNVRRFIEDELDNCSGAIITKSKLYSAYKNWVIRQGESYTASNQEFAKLLIDMTDAVEGRNKNERFWKEIELIDLSLVSLYGL